MAAGALLGRAKGWGTTPTATTASDRPGPWGDGPARPGRSMGSFVRTVAPRCRCAGPLGRRPCWRGRVPRPPAAEVPPWGRGADSAVSRRGQLVGQGQRLGDGVLQGERPAGLPRGGEGRLAQLDPQGCKVGLARRPF